MCSQPCVNPSHDPPEVPEVHIADRHSTAECLIILRYHGHLHKMLRLPEHGPEGDVGALIPDLSHILVKSAGPKQPLKNPKELIAVSSPLQHWQDSDPDTAVVLTKPLTRSQSTC